MKASMGTQGLILNEPLLWERGRKGRSGFSLPRRDVERLLPAELRLAAWSADTPVPQYVPLSNVPALARASSSLPSSTSVS